MTLSSNKKLKRNLIAFSIILLRPFIVPCIIILIIFFLIFYITDIFYIGIKNEDKSDMKNEIKYYTTDEYTDKDSYDFFKSVGDFISGLFTEVISDADWPVVGKSAKDITSYYGKRNAPTAGASTVHSGIDIAAPEGTKLVAIMEGEITKASWGGSGGYTITIVSGEYTFSYCHCSSEFQVKVGDKVKKGQVIRKSWT